MCFEIRVIEGDPLAVPADVLVSPWTTNWIPWWMLNHMGLQGEVRLRGGDEPYRELRRAGRLAHGGAFQTSAGTLPFRGIIHVALTNLLMSSSEAVVTRAIENAVGLATRSHHKTLCVPVMIVPRLTREQSLDFNVQAFERLRPSMGVTVVTYSTKYLRHLRRPYRKGWAER